MAYEKSLACVCWTAEDVRTLRPDLTEAQAWAFLERNEGHIVDRLTELGWGVIETLLDLDEQLPAPLKVGDRVVWTDPDGGIASGPGTIHLIDGERLWVRKDDGGEVEAFFEEVRRA